MARPSYCCARTGVVRAPCDAEDAVQEASLRALRYFGTFGGGNGRAWFLRIVRNICRGWRGRSFRAPTDPFDEAQHSSARPAADPEALLLRTDGVTLIARAMSARPNSGDARNHGPACRSAMAASSSMDLDSLA
ncbi:MAG TPA: sigma factor [Vicinamibacteria bacterium]|nr:sigma factor [Vicinamibacteria bacterium]